MKPELDMDGIVLCGTERVIGQDDGPITSALRHSEGSFWGQQHSEYLWEGQPAFPCLDGTKQAGRFPTEG